jgi:hypothetical protein
MRKRMGGITPPFLPLSFLFLLPEVERLDGWQSGWEMR